MVSGVIFVKKRVTLPALLLALLLLFAGCSTGEQGETVYSIAGNVLEYSDTELVLSTSTAQYQFDISAAQQEENGLSLAVGCQVIVYYTGQLSPQQAISAQRFEVSRPASPGQTVTAVGSTPQSKAVADLYNSMTLEQKVGQLILASYDAASAAEIAQNCHPAGFLLGSEDFAGKTTEIMAQELASYQTLEGVGLWLGTSEEGGSVAPVSGNDGYRAYPFYSPQQIYASRGLEGFDTDTKERCALLTSMGLNLNLAPVFNVSTDPAQEIYSRTLGQDATVTGQYVNDVVQANLASGIQPVLKYFPTYGTTQENGIRVDSRSWEEINATDLASYSAGAGAGAQAVLVSHCIVNCLDDANPVSLSVSAMYQIRTNMGFNGVLIAEDVNQAGLEAYCSGSLSPAVQAVVSGADLVIAGDPAGVYQQLYTAVQDGVISQQRLMEAVVRTLTWKQSAGLAAVVSE